MDDYYLGFLRYINDSKPSPKGPTTCRTFGVQAYTTYPKSPSTNMMRTLDFHIGNYQCGLDEVLACRQVCVLGGGVLGTAIARAAARRGLATTLLERCPRDSSLRYLPEPPNYPLRHPKYHLIETIRPLIEVHWGV